MTRRFAALSILTAAVAGSIGAPFELAAILLLLPALALLLGPRIRLSATFQVVGTFSVAFAGILAVRLLLAEPYKHPVDMLSERELLFMMPLLMSAGFRALLDKPRFGAGLTLVLGALSLSAAGGALSGPAFPILAALFCVLALCTLAIQDPDRRRRLRPAPGTVGALLLSGLLVGGTLAAAALLLPRVHAMVMDKMYERLRSARTGFSTRLELEGRNHLLEDARVVLRVRGQHVPRLLRGAVFTRYQAGRWLASRSSSAKTLGEPSEALRTPPSNTERIELEHARRPERYFLPRDANSINPSSGHFFRDEFGIVYPPEESFAKRIWFDREKADAIIEPQPEDTIVPQSLSRELSAVLSDWGVSGGAPAERLQQVHAHLQRYRHSLDSQRATKKDPVIDFLRHNPEGHCEYFASAMALLARSAKVPARVVSGYRVAELSPFGYHIVRRLHAHSWVEVWLDGQWVSLDPTPPGESMRANLGRTPLFSALMDGVRTAWVAADDWLERRTTFEMALALLALAGLLALVRTLRQGRPTPRSKAFSDPPLPGFAALDASLAGKGIARSPTETLSSFSKRVESSPELPEAERREIAAALRDYALLRYAGRGDGPLLDRSLQALSRSTRGHRPKL